MEEKYFVTRVVIETFEWGWSRMCPSYIGDLVLYDSYNDAAKAIENMIHEGKYQIQKVFIKK